MHCWSWHAPCPAWAQEQTRASQLHQCLLYLNRILHSVIFQKEKSSFSHILPAFLHGLVEWRSSTRLQETTESFPINLLVQIHCLSNITEGKGTTCSRISKHCTEIQFEMQRRLRSWLFIILELIRRSTEKAWTTREHRTYMERLLLANSIFTLSKCNWKLILNFLQKEK